MTGTIVTIHADRGFGFISVDGRPKQDCYFHASGLDESLEFGEQLVERRVAFELVTVVGRERAVNIHPAE